MSMMQIASLVILAFALVALAMSSVVLAGGVGMAFIMWIAARIRRGDES